MFHWVKTKVLDFLEKIYASEIVKREEALKSGKKPVTRVPCRVISIGNLTWGGTGKTPITIFLAENLASFGKRVAVLTRGYGDDEHFELQDRLQGIPVLVGKDRAALARAAVEKHRAEIILLDDGFQHRALARDLDIVAINSTHPFGNARLIPAGPLREPMSALKRAHAFVLSQSFLGRHNLAGIKQKLAEIHPGTPLFEADHQPIAFMDFRKGRPLPLDMIRGERVAVLSAIEDPTSFENTLSRLGARVVYAARFTDHHVFKAGELKRVFDSCHENRARYLVTTLKDSYRLKRILATDDRLPTRVLVLKMDVRFDDEEGFLQYCLGEALPVRQDPDPLPAEVMAPADVPGTEAAPQS